MMRKLQASFLWTQYIVHMLIRWSHVHAAVRLVLHDNWLEKKPPEQPNCIVSAIFQVNVDWPSPPLVLEENLSLADIMALAYYWSDALPVTHQQVSKVIWQRAASPSHIDCLGQPHTLPQTAAPTVHALSHSYATNTPLVIIGHPTFAPQITPPMDWSPYSTTCLIIVPSDLPSQTASISYQPFCQSALYRQTDTQTIKWLEGMSDDYRPISLYRQRRNDPNHAWLPYPFFTHHYTSKGVRHCAFHYGSPVQVCECPLLCSKLK